MGVIVGVHGIGKQQLGRHQLLAPWTRAVADGLEKAAGQRVAEPSLDVAFYGDLVWPQPDDPDTGVGGASKSGASLSAADWVSAEPEEVELASWSPQEVVELEASLREVVSKEEIAAARQRPSKGYTRLP